jgi:hypothetical protein
LLPGWLGLVAVYLALLAGWLAGCLELPAIWLAVLASWLGLLFGWLVG